MGRVGHGIVTALNMPGSRLTGKDFEAAGDCVNTPDCEGADDAPPDGPASTQSETSIAVDSTGQHIVIGFNDFRGFASNPISVSGFKYSDDGGQTFVDGGQLPSPGTDSIGAIKLPQVLGDPDVKYIGGCTFVYSSILIKKFSAATAVETMAVHRSTDCGHTWVGPFEVTAATNPNGLVDAAGEAEDAADKEFMDVDPDSGRVVMSWSNFTPVAAGRVEISTTFSTTSPQRRRRGPRGALWRRPTPTARHRSRGLRATDRATRTSHGRGSPNSSRTTSASRARPTTARRGARR